VRECKPIEELPGVSVALPVHRDQGTLGLALGDILAQTHRDLDIMLVLNGADERTRDCAVQGAAGDPRVRVIELEGPGLARALNAALRGARHDLVARMDADDRCAPERVACQARWMQEHPSAGAVGCWWELADSDGAQSVTVRPPTDPRELAWRLLVGNPLAHGSMMLRRSAVRSVGGYEERLARGQDYDLWLRLVRAASIGVVPEVLYTHTRRDGSGALCAGDAQARAAAEVMLREWGSLESCGPGARGTLAGLLVSAMSTAGDAPDAMGRFEDFLTEFGPSREALSAYLWARDHLPTMSRRAAEACRRARLREVGARLRGDGVNGVVLWGAGAHAGWILRHAEDLGVPVTGIVDDQCAGQERHGTEVRAPERLGAGEHALIASDAHEEEIWARSRGARERGVVVWRLYADHGVAQAW
jgi:hypothetical protein